jgi:hypothetical protein
MGKLWRREAYVSKAIFGGETELRTDRTETGKRSEYF